ncbi:MAG: hypothetical protein NTV52_09900 [Acidobacteria bacterium]|nr:hypothetical protein [Acidobacteriota bacterium]
MSTRSEALAVRLEAGASALAAFAATLSDTEWQTPVPKDGRKVGIVVHHVASVYPIEIHLAQELAAAIRALTDAELDNAAPVSLNSDAPLTCQFLLEDHAVRHSYHHLESLHAALGR